MESKVYMYDRPTGKMPVYYDDGKSIHLCGGADTQGHLLLWSYCGSRDVPANKGFTIRHGYEVDKGSISCPACLSKLNN